MPQSARITRKKTDNPATIQDLGRVEHSLFQLAGTGNLPAVGRRWLFFCVALVRMGYDGIKAPMWAIMGAQHRAQGLIESESTAYRGLAVLEHAGYIRRQKYRVGPDRFATIVHFNLDKFKFWTQNRPHLIPVTPAYINSQLSSCEKTDVTSNGSLVNTPNSYSYELDQPARVRDVQERFKKTTWDKEQRQHPIIYSLRKVTQGFGKKHRKPLIALAELELQNPKKRVSGIDWDKWLARNEQSGRAAFEELSIPHERESVVRDQFIPYLENMTRAGFTEKVIEPIKRIVKKATASDPDPQPNETEPPSLSDITDMLRDTQIGTAIHGDSEDSEDKDLASPGDVKELLKDSPIGAAIENDENTEETKPENTLSSDDLHLLRQARQRAQLEKERKG